MRTAAWLDLKAAIRRFIEAHNEHSAKPFRWNKTVESIISSVVGRALDSD